MLEVEEQLVAETADGLVVLLVQRDQHDVLRIGQPQLVEHRLVDPVEGQVRRIDREAQEVVELGNLLRSTVGFCLATAISPSKCGQNRPPDT